MDNSRKATLRRSSSLESTASTNVGPSRTAQHGNNVLREVKSPIYSCAAVLIHCDKHHVVGLQTVPDRKGKTNVFY